MKKIALLASILLLSTVAFAQTTWKVDAAHSSVNFNIKHMGIAFVPGKFDKFEGTVTTSKNDFSDAKISFTVDVNSINTGNDARDKHLKNKDFFDVEKYKEMKFVSTGFKKSAADKKTEKLGGEAYELTGNLTIKDVTKPATFKVVYFGEAKDKDGNKKIGFMAKNTINRFDYNISFDPQGKALAKDVDIIIHLELAEKK